MTRIGYVICLMHLGKPWGYASGRTKSDLVTDTMLARALVKCLEIVGEAASGISKETKESAQTIPRV